MRPFFTGRGTVHVPVYEYVLQTVENLYLNIQGGVTTFNR